MKWIALWGLLWTSTAWAGGVVALTDTRVAQYREALTAAQQVLGASGKVIDASAPDATDQLNRADPAVILAVGQKALETAKTRTTPTVFCMVLAGAMGSRTVTGVKLEVPAAAQLEELKLVHPKARRVGIIYEPKASGPMVEEAVKAAGRLGLTVVSRPVADAKAVRPALLEIADGIDVLLLMPDPHLITSEMFAFLLSFTLERNIALFGFFESFTKAGALASFAPDYVEIGKRAAKIALDLSAKPTDARVPVPALVGSPGVLTINVKTAKRLGIDLPAAVLSKARKVYE
jgi:putative ABC transport system substrate-binding protein